MADLSIDRHQLASYDEVCGFRHSDVLPPTYPHILGFPLAVTLMVDPGFPFPLAGLVHINNRITQRRVIRADERMTVRVHAENLREHPRGRQFDMITDATINGEPVWTESSTYLRRERRAADKPSQSPTSSQKPTPTAIWRVPANIGRRYAAVSGDVNPIHLNPLAAKLFGFRRTIAHGMWLKARCLAALEGRLSDAMTAGVEFRSPLLVPSTVAFSAHQGVDDWAIAVAHASSGRPHLDGRVTAAGEP